MNQDRSRSKSKKKKKKKEAIEQKAYKQGSNA